MPSSITSKTKTITYIHRNKEIVFDIKSINRSVELFSKQHNRYIKKTKGKFSFIHTITLNKNAASLIGNPVFILFCLCLDGDVEGWWEASIAF